MRCNQTSRGQCSACNTGCSARLREETRTTLFDFSRKANKRDDHNRKEQANNLCAIRVSTCVNAVGAIACAKTKRARKYEENAINNSLMFGRKLQQLRLRQYDFLD